VLLGLLYLLLRRVVRLIAGSSNDQMNTEIELLVLRHQLKVVRRHVGKPRLRRRATDPRCRSRSRPTDGEGEP
jgi:hypothetical protein